MRILNDNPKATLPKGKSQSMALSRNRESVNNVRNIKQSFDDWFMDNYSRLKEIISIASILDEDAFHEAYLAIATDPKLSEKSNDFRKVFLSTYRTISRRSLNECYAVCHPDELFFTLLPDTTEDEEPQKDYSCLAKDIGNFIRNTFTQIQQSVWQMRVQGYSIRDTADCFNLNDRQVKADIETVICRTREQFAFAM